MSCLRSAIATSVVASGVEVDYERVFFARRDFPTFLYIPRGVTHDLPPSSKRRLCLALVSNADSLLCPQQESLQVESESGANGRYLSSREQILCAVIASAMAVSPRKRIAGSVTAKLSRNVELFVRRTICGRGCEEELRL